MARNTIAEILSLKARSEFDPIHHLEDRLNEIQAVLNLAKTIDDQRGKEMLKYVPVVTIACCESFFRIAIKEIIDFGGVFRDNVSKSDTAKTIKWEVFNAIQQKSITLGELISHSLSCSNFEDIDKNVSAIIGTSFFEAIKIYREKSIQEDLVKISDQFCNNFGKIIQDVKRFFELRHIICHESAMVVDPDKNNIQECFDSFSCFLQQSNLFLWNLLYPNEPETQEEMNEHSAAQFSEIDKKLSEVCAEILPLFKGDNKSVTRFEDTIAKWDSYRRAKAELDALVVEAGTMYPSLYFISMVETTKLMLDTLANEYKINAK
jgi:hypothetical protein